MTEAIDKSGAGESAEAGEEALIRARRQKAEAVRARGDNPFANDVDRAARAFLGDVRDRYGAALAGETYDAEKVSALGAGAVHTVFGRLVGRRGFGKASFLRLRDASGELQVFCRADLMGAGFEHLKDIDLGDHLEVVGSAMVTKTGELSIEATKLRLVTKALRPPPDKWHGLSDVDLRYRRRYVDMVSSPDVAEVIAARSSVLRAIRGFLDGRGFLEVETPMLHSVIGGAAARPFETHHNTLDLDLFLRIAPELYLKRLLVGGLERVYEIGRCFRNEGISTRHNPEFTMMELYQAYADYELLMELAEGLIRHVDGCLKADLAARRRPELYESWAASRTFTLLEPFARVPMDRAIERALSAAGLDARRVVSSFELLALVPEKTPADQRAQGDALVQEWSRAASRRFDWGNLRRALGHSELPGEHTFVAYEYFAEPFLTEDYRSEDGTKSRPVFITDYPAAVSPLARRKDSDPSLVDRFELFVDGREIGNAFSELNDPEDQAARFRDQVEKKSRGAEETMDYDEDYVMALEHGMPPAAGFGIGVDRLVMMLTSQSSIRDVIAFPLLRPEGHRGHEGSKDEE